VVMFSSCSDGELTWLPARWNASWWGYWVCCTKVQDVEGQGEETEFDRYLKAKDGDGWVKTTLLQLTCPPDKYFGEFLNSSITGFTECRQDWSHMPRYWITYHSFTVLDIEEGQMYIIMEKKTDRLEIMIGKGEHSRNFMRDFSAMLRIRNQKRCAELPRQSLKPGFLTVRSLLEWIDGPLARNWQTYNLMSANCQHFTDELHQFLQSGAPAVDVGLEKVLQKVVADVQISPSSLEDLPAHLLKERNLILAAVEANPKVLQYVPEHFKQDWRVVMTAVSKDGDVLQHAAEAMRGDPEVVQAAVKSGGRAVLEHASEELREAPP